MAWRSGLKRLALRALGHKLRGQIKINLGRLALFPIFVSSLLSACIPIDQRTFNPNAGKPPVVQEPAPLRHNAATDQPAFLQIMQGTPEEDYGQAIDSAVKLALKRKRNILFIVRGLAPMQPTPQQQAEILDKLNQDLVTPVAKRIIAAGARSIQIEMQVATLPAIQQAMVQVNVR